MTRIETVRVGTLHDAAVVGEPAPTLSWVVATDEADWHQGAYEVEVVDGDGSFTTGRVPSSISVGVPWPSTPLRSRERREVRIRVWAQDDERPTTWSEPVTVEAGLLEAAEWEAQLIGPAGDERGPTPRPAHLLWRDFELENHPDVERARLHVTAHGVVDVELNGTPVSDEVLAPGWTSYDHRLCHRTHDVTDLVRPGKNRIGAVLADGWYRGWVGFEGGVRDLYGERTGLLLQLEVQHSDGSTTRVMTDNRWRSAPSSILATGIYEGEHQDARRQTTGWSLPGTDVPSANGVDQLHFDPAVLVPAEAPPMRPVERLVPASIHTSPSGRTIVDFGQNLVGRCRIRARGEAGDTIVLRHAEVLEQGELGRRPLRRAAAEDTYVLNGDGTEEWEPRFTFHGFRYVDVEGWPGELTAEDIEAVVVHTDMERTGWFNCSDPLVDRLHENVVWSMRGNFLSIPMDCPQRDERLGWTGDIQVFAPTAAFLYDCHGLLRSWLQDLAAEQDHYGTVPIYVPWVPLIFPLIPVAAWGDAAVVVPWVLYQRSGNRGALERAYPSMLAWVEQVQGLLSEQGLWDHGFQFGDWLDPAAPPDRPDAGRTDEYLVATAYAVQSARLCADAASVLGREADAEWLAQAAERTAASFRREFVSPSGRLVSDSQTAYAVALQFDLLEDDDRRRRAGERLVELVRDERFHIGTGFVGTPIVSDALSEIGALDTAYHLLQQDSCPSWLYPVTMGATTTWERWDSMLPDGRVNPGDMTSFNHYALGAVADWLHRVVAGLAPIEPGYRRFAVAPRPGGGLTSARASHRTPYGLAAVQWERQGSRLDVEVTVPANTRAVVDLPDDAQDLRELGSGIHRLSCEFRPPAEDPKPPPERLPWEDEQPLR